MMSKLAGGRRLIILFLLFLALTAAFIYLGQLTGISWIDGMSAPGPVLAYIGALTPQQKLIHIAVTATFDVAYPLVYGMLFAGMALRYWRGLGFLLALPAFVVIGVDLAEGVVQILLLLGQLGLVGMKAWLTPLKTGLFILALAIAVGGMLKSFVSGYRGR